MKPYSMKRPLTIKERIFNYRLSRARHVSENAFDIMVSRFWVYEKPIPLQLHKVDQLIKATCVLHNWLRQITSMGMLCEECSCLSYNKHIHIMGLMHQNTHMVYSELNESALLFDIM